MARNLNVHPDRREASQRAAATRLAREKLRASKYLTFIRSTGRDPLPSEWNEIDAQVTAAIPGAS